MNPKCNLPEEERAEILGMFHEALSAEEEDTARALFPQYLFFRNEYDDTGMTEDGPTRICTCTACRESFAAVRGNYKRGKLHNEPCNCPNCGARVTGKAVTKFRYDMKSLESWIKTAVAYPGPDGALLIEAGDCRRRFNWDELCGEIDWFPKAMYYFRPGAVQMWKEVIMGWDCKEKDVEVGWLSMGTVTEPFQPNMMGYVEYHGDYNVIGLPEALEKSAFKYCQILPFYEYEYAAKLGEGKTARWMMKYLAWYALHPQIEMAVKLGLSDAMRELVQDGKPNKRLLNWDATTPAGFLRMSKEDARLFTKAGMSFGDLKEWRETAAKHSLKEYINLADMVGGPDNLKEVSGCARLAGVELDKAARYIARLIPPCRQYAPPTSTIIRTWKDYLDMARKLNYDLKEPTVVMPKDLQERHDAAANIIRYNASEAKRKKYKKRLKKLEKQYAFTSGELSIVVPKSSEEIIQEGKTLHHCVGGYAARHIEGKTTILFLRKRRTPGRSFLTVELEETRGRIGIRQIHGYQNENYRYNYGKRGISPKERYADFLQTWLDWVNEGSKRDRDGRPILTEQEAKTA